MSDLPQIYNSRILKSYVRCLEVRYPNATVEHILKNARISKYELEDPGH